MHTGALTHRHTCAHSRTSSARSRCAHAEEQLGAFPRRPCACPPPRPRGALPGRGAHARASPSPRSGSTSAGLGPRPPGYTDACAPPCAGPCGRPRGRSERMLSPTGREHLCLPSGSEAALTPGGAAVTTEEVPSTGHSNGPTAEASLPPQHPARGRLIRPQARTHPSPLEKQSPGLQPPSAESTTRQSRLPGYRQPPAPGSQASRGSPGLQCPDVPGWSALSFFPDSPSGTPRNPRLFPTHPSRWKLPCKEAWASPPCCPGLP